MILYHFEISFFILDNILCLKSISYSQSHSRFFLLIFTLSIFSHPFSFHLFLSLYLKYIFISSLWLEMHFLKIQSDKFCHLLEVFQPFIFSVIIDTIRFNLVVYFFNVSHLFYAFFWLEYFYGYILSLSLSYCCNSSLWYFRLRILQEICLSYEVVF